MMSHSCFCVAWLGSQADTLCPTTTFFSFFKRKILLLSWPGIYNAAKTKSLTEPRTFSQANPQVSPQKWFLKCHTRWAENKGSITFSRLTQLLLYKSKTPLFSLSLVLKIYVVTSCLKLVVVSCNLSLDTDNTTQHRHTELLPPP